MTPAEGISKLGFRRWYERQLIESHMYFVTCFLCLIVVAVSLEQIDWRGPLPRVAFLLSVIIAGGALCVASLRRYSFLLARAEILGAQSSCARCATYGVLTVMDASRGEEHAGGMARAADNPCIRVRCKKCGHEWLMENE